MRDARSRGTATRSCIHLIALMRWGSVVIPIPAQPKGVRVLPPPPSKSDLVSCLSQEFGRVTPILIQWAESADIGSNTRKSSRILIENLFPMRAFASHNKQHNACGLYRKKELINVSSRRILPTTCPKEGNEQGETSFLGYLLATKAKNCTERKLAGERTFFFLHRNIIFLLLTNYGIQRPMKRLR